MGGRGEGALRIRTTCTYGDHAGRPVLNTGRIFAFVEMRRPTSEIESKYGIHDLLNHSLTTLPVSSITWYHPPPFKHRNN